MKRSTLEKIFLVFFLPAVFLMYAIKAYPAVVTSTLGINDPLGTYFYLGGKNPNFWYQTLYTGIVVGICILLLFKGRSPYGLKPGRRALSKYQKYKFTSIFVAQLVMFYFIPFILPMLKSGVWNDTPPQNSFVAKELTHNFKDNPINFSATNNKYELLVYANDELVPPENYSTTHFTQEGTGSTYADSITFKDKKFLGQQITVTAFHLKHKMAHVYVSDSFFSKGAFIYMFVIIPIFVWFFGKRYCSWICACGNLAETIGTTKWGAKWVKEGTPRGEKTLSLEIIQTAMLLFALVVGASAILNLYNMINPTTYHRLWYLQDFLTDFMFGSLIGVGLYPFFGTRIWCRYGCPMARWMNIFGRFAKSKFAVVPNDKCKGINACTAACPMGIPVADYAHKDRKPIEISFGLDSTSCIGCGGCIDSCPVDALTFKKIGDTTTITTKDT